jgi:hypothetical protein
MLNTLVAKTLSKVFKGTATDPNSKIPGRRSDLSIRMRQVFFNKKERLFPFMSNI